MPIESYLSGKKGLLQGETIELVQKQLKKMSILKNVIPSTAIAIFLLVKLELIILVEWTGKKQSFKVMNRTKLNSLLYGPGNKHD